MKHTPGPWRFAMIAGGISVIDSENGGVADIVSGRPDEELYANAYAIAVVPEMIAVIKKMVTAAMDRNSDAVIAAAIEGNTLLDHIESKAAKEGRSNVLTPSDFALLMGADLGKEVNKMTEKCGIGLMR